MVNRRRLHDCRNHVLFDHSPFGAEHNRGNRRGHSAIRSYNRPGAERHQARARPIHHLAARLHVSGCGVAAYSAAIFHLMTHAFFQGTALPCGGFSDPRHRRRTDLRKMGGLRKKIPVTFWTMTIGVFAIAGFPPLAAFFSKDAISTPPQQVVLAMAL